jgi:hypothetical protein
VEGGDNLIKEEAKDVCARPHSGIRFFMISEVNKGSMKEEYEDEGSTEEDNNKESNHVEDKNADSGRSGFLVSPPDNDCKGGIDSMIGGGGPIDPQSLCGIGNNDGNKDCAQHKTCIGCDGLSLFPHDCKGLSILQEKVRIPLWSGSRVFWEVGRRIPIGFSRFM